jgi:membrane protein
MTGKKRHKRARWAAWRRSVLHGGRWLHMLAFCAKRFMKDDGPRLAAGLSYASLLALVPMLAIGLSILAAFPAFEEIRESLRNFIISSLMPERSAVVNAQFAQFVENAGKLTGPGLLALAAAAVLLLANIQGAFNKIWRVTEPRSLAIRFLTYWALLTLGPLFVGSSLWISSYAFAAVSWVGGDTWSGMVEVSYLLSLALAGLGLTLIYLVVPNRRVRLWHALIGGTVAAVLLEVLKYGFGFYLANFPSYEAVYGALATIPIFLVWMFMAWAVVLLGAEIVAGLPEWRATRARGTSYQGPGERLALALSLIARLRKASTVGESLRERQLLHGLPATPAEFDEVLALLRAGGFAERTRGTRWALIRDLRAVSLADLMRVLLLRIDPGEGWPGRPAAVVQQLRGAIMPNFERSLEELLAEQDGDEEVGTPSDGTEKAAE